MLFPPVSLLIQLTLTACCLTLGGCSALMMSQNTAEEVHQRIELPSNWTQNVGPQQQEISAISIPPWLVQFEDPQLSRLVKEALKSNYELKAVVARMERARAHAASVSAILKPDVSATLTSVRSRSNTTQKNIGTSTALGVDISWEVDLWDRLSSQAKASVSDFEITQADWHGARLSLAANVAKAWFDVTEARMQVELIQRRIKNLSNNLSTIEQEFSLGLKDALDVYLARASVERERAKRARRTLQYERANQTLAIFLGRYPSVELTGVIDELPLNSMGVLKNKVPVGLPSELLLRRWDLIAWQHRLASADSRAFAAHYDRFPRFSLTSSVGSRSDKFKDLLSSDYFIWSFIGGLSAPLFDGKRLANEELKARATVQEVEANYGQIVLAAFQQVESAIRAEELLWEEENALKRTVNESIAAEKLAFEKYLNGLVDFITVLESQRSSFDSQSAAIDIRNQRLQNRVDLHLALGGSF